MPFIPTTEKEEQDMLRAIGVETFEDLLETIPERVRFHGSFNLPDSTSELEAFQLMRRLAQQNHSVQDYTCFLGGGAYDHYIPSVVNHILLRSEFYTAYTPYQPEVSQGNLQAIFEYQSMISNLTAMDVTNASMYDAGSALAEAALMAYHVKNRAAIIVSKAVNPFYRDVLRTYLHGQNIDIREIDVSADGITDVNQLKKHITDQTAGVIIQHPNFLGNLENVHEIEAVTHASGALFITSNDPLSLGLLEPPGAYNADIVTGEGQVLGNPLAFGGPYLGIFSVKQEFIRKMPGRLIGRTVDSQGRPGFVMTLQTREQHIRRDKATSNICTNNALNALAATIYLSLLGKQGIQEVANQCLQKSHYLAEKIAAIPGFELKFKAPFFKEFVIKTPIPAADVIAGLKDRKILAGIDLSKFDYGFENALLVAVTEKRSQAELDAFAESLAIIVD
ncbi:MAG: aminomethyl-transferring glycine dehydrogenase subunit GcvPA [Calditrichaeota bacterium]|nr:aminomethyl-transferring glycine dehydrogenase subunit GcvPA [Calditrichota bacterium]